MGNWGAFIVIHKSHAGSSTGAKCPIDPCRVGVSLNERAFSILNFHLYGAAHGAHTADTVYLLLCHRHLPEPLSIWSTAAIQGISMTRTDMKLVAACSTPLRILFEIRCFFHDASQAIL